MAGSAIEWGRGADQEPWGLVTCRVGPEDVTAIVRDRGPGFAPNSVQDPLDVRPGCIGDPGIGIMPARGLVEILSDDDRGNEVTLVKRFGPEPRG